MGIVVDPVILTEIKNIILSSLNDADRINKIYIAGVGAFAALGGVLSTLWVARQHRKDQKLLAARQLQVNAEIAELQRAMQAELSRHSLAMQEFTSRRTGIMSIATKRQAWIDELRKDIARFVALCKNLVLLSRSISVHLAVMSRLKDSSECLINFSERRNNFHMEAEEILCRVTLRLNPEEDMHKQLVLDMINGILTSLQFSVDLKDYEQNNKLRDELLLLLDAVTDTAAKILKEEWIRVKNESCASPDSTIFH